jgi:hypothetical protein
MSIVITFACYYVNFLTGVLGSAISPSRSLGSSAAWWLDVLIYNIYMCSSWLSYRYMGHRSLFPQITWECLDKYQERWLGIPESIE